MNLAMTCSSEYNQTYPHPPDKFNFRYFFKFPFDLDLPVSFKVKCFVDNSLGKKIFNMFLVFLAGHVDSVLIFTDDLTSTIDLQVSKSF